MCLIAYQPANVSIPIHTLKTGWQSDPHGAGYMFCHDGKLVIRKPFFKWADFLASYTADYAKHGADSPFVVHFRWATHGGRTAQNTHPHELCDGMVGLVHNGILPFDPPAKAVYSDTVHFCNTVLACREPAQLLCPDFAEVLGDMIGSYNKLVLMNCYGDVSIVNETEGVWDGSVWYSNYDYLPSVYGKGSASGLGLSRGSLPARYSDDYGDEEGEVCRGTTFSHKDVWDGEEGDEELFKYLIAEEEEERADEEARAAMGIRVGNAFEEHEEEVGETEEQADDEVRYRQHWRDKR